MLRVIVLGATVLTAVGVIATGTPASAAPSTTKSIQQQIDSQANALEKIVEQYDGVTQQLTNNTAASAKLKAQMGPALAASQAARDHVGDLAAAAYMRGSAGTLSTLVASDNTSDMLDTLGTLNELAKAAKEDVASYQATVDAYNAQKKKLDGLISVENSQKASLTAQKATINKQLTSLYALRAKAYGTSTETATTSHVVPPYIPGRGGKIVAFAYKQLGKPYSWGADGPGSYDCSGLVLAAYRSVGISLYHEAEVQYKDSVHISRSQLSPGDLVFYERGDLHHVAIYIGNNQVIHAPQPGEVVKIASIGMMSAYGYGRIK